VWIQRARRWLALPGRMLVPDGLGGPGVGARRMVATRRASSQLPETRSREQKVLSRSLPVWACAAFLRATRAHWRQRLEFVGAERDWSSHLGLNSIVL